MNKSVNPLLALLIVSLFGSLLWLNFHFYAKALDVPKITHIKKKPGDSIVLRLGSKLYNYQSGGKLQGIIDLEKLGIKGTSGDFDFFSNGDLLINSDEYQRTTKENLAAYARMKNNNTAPPKQGRGLFRCKLSQQQCEVFNQSIPEIQGPHFLHIDRVTDEVYLADTTRHAIRKLSPDGELLAELTSGLKFPNQVYLEHGKKQNKLWVVDTNHHVVKALNPANQNFGELIEKHKTTLDRQWVWPSAFSRIGKSWAVHISDNAMENARIAVFDKKWVKSHELVLPKKADPVASEVIDDKLIVADANNYTLYQFDQYGTRLNDFADKESSNGIRAQLEENKAQDKQYRQWSDWILYGGIGLFILFFAYALKQAIDDAKEAKEHEAYTDDPAQLDNENIIRLAKLPIEGEWIEAKPYFKQMKWYVLAIIVFSIAILLYMVKLTGNLPTELLVTMFIFSAMMGLIFLPLSKIANYKIGFFKNNVTIKTDKGQLISAPYQDIKWGKRFFTIGEWFIPIGNPNQSIFPYDKLQQKLIPYLSPRHKTGEMDALKLQWASPEGMLKQIVFASLLGLVLIVML